jgi:hypothetical protein
MDQSRTNSEEKTGGEIRTGLPRNTQMAARSRRPSKLMSQLRYALRGRHYSPRTEDTYCLWVKRFIFFHRLRHPAEMGERQINEFLSHLAVKGRVSSSTQNQALRAILFLYVKAGLILDRYAGLVLDTLTGFPLLSWWHDFTPPRTSGRDPLIGVRGFLCRSEAV